MLYTCKENFNKTAVEESLSEIISRHEVLRTQFIVKDGHPQQIIAPFEPLRLQVVDLRDFSIPERELRAQQLVRQQAHIPFNLAEGPLLRACLFILDEKDHVLSVTVHHIIFDGWSIDIFISEFVALYTAFSNGKAAAIPELAIQYGDFSIWQRKWLKGEILETQLNYWKSQLSDAVPLLELPTDFSRPAIQTYKGDYQPILLNRSLTAKLKRVSRQEGASLFMILLAAFQTLLYHYTGQEDIIVGSPIANRNRADISGLIGFFLNTLALRTKLGGNPTFREIFKQVRETALSAYLHQDIPFEMIVDELQSVRDLSYTPIFQVMFVLQNFKTGVIELPGLSLSPIDLIPDTTKFDLNLHLFETEAGIQGVLIYNKDLFASNTIINLVDRFQILLESIVTNPDQQILELATRTPTELYQQTARASSVYPSNSFQIFPMGEIEQTIQSRFEKQVKKYPNNIAISTNQHKWAYDELNRISNRVAHTILDLFGKAEGKVALLFEHDAPMITGLIGALKAGRTYVPLDPSYPRARLAFMLQDSGASILLTNTKNQKLAEELLGDEENSSESLICINVDTISIDTPEYNLELPSILQQPCLYPLHIRNHRAAKRYHAKS